MSIRKRKAEVINSEDDSEVENADIIYEKILSLTRNRGTDKTCCEYHLQLNNCFR